MQSTALNRRLEERGLFRATLMALFSLMLLFSASVSRAHGHRYYGTASITEAHAVCVLCEHSNAPGLFCKAAEAPIALTVYGDAALQKPAAVVLPAMVTGLSARGPPAICG